jgi:HK97 family phage prohead protease
MNKIFNLTSTFKAHEGDDGCVMIRGMASTADFDRAGDSISAEAWQKGGISNFEKNPIILFNHDYDKPIGRATAMKAGPNGLELECKISKSAPGNVAELIKDGVLGAFSVGFRVKDADYMEETDGLMIKDAELFEVSVVSVPCNQSATFSLAKSFDSTEEYEEFKKTFTNRVDLAGQSLAKDEVITSGIASDNTPQSADINSADQEIKMDNQNIDLEAFAKKVADETAAKIAMKQAEQKAAEQAETEKAAEQASFIEGQEIKVKTGIQSGIDALMADVRAEITAKDAKMDEVLAKYAKELEEKSAEMTAMTNSKKSFTDRSSASDADMTPFAKELMYGHLLGVMTGKGWNTNYSQGVMQKFGVEWDSGLAAVTTGALGIAQAVSTQIEKEIMAELKLAQAFREITINSQTQVLPIQTDALPATWGSNTVATGNLTNRPQVDANQYNAQQVILKATRLVSTTFMDNNIDEEVLINLMPMLVEGVARAHARAVDNAILNGTATGGNLEGFAGLEALAAANKVNVLNQTTVDAVVTAQEFLNARKLMGKYGMVAGDVAYIVSQARYYDLIADAGFADITDVGSDLATKITGTVGAIYGSPVIVSDQIEGDGADGGSIGYAVNVRNHVIPRLRGVSIEQDYEVMNQRNVIVASQSLGFNQLRANNGTTDISVVKLVRTDA